MKYPYWLVISRVGRLSAPIQYRHTPIEKMFESGKIGGVRLIEKRFENYNEAKQYAHSEEINKKSVEILVVRSPNSCRIHCPTWRNR